MDDTGIKREPVIRINNDRMEAFIMLPLLKKNTTIQWMRCLKL